MINILEVDDVYITILKKLNIKSICSLLLVNIFSNNKITKYYENNEISFNDMPLFRPCNNISKYLIHYKSFNSGTNFPEQPLWLFNDADDCKYIEINNVYTKFENMKFKRPKFFSNVIYISNRYQKFEKSFDHWKKLNEQQKYLVWCAITSYHPEIKLEKSLICIDMISLLSEIYWHYQCSFVRYYLEIYCIDDYGLLNSKRIAEREILSELEHYKINHFVRI